MRTGLLLCDHLDPDKAAIDGDYTELFPARFGPAGLDLRIYDSVRGEFPGDLDECEAWMVSGSRHCANDDLPWIAELEDLIRTAHADERPLVGICFGHQLIARALGGRVETAVGWGIGARGFDLVAHPPGVPADADSFRLLMSHRDQVVVAPEGAEVFATADYCPIAGYTVGRHILTVQGHPEFTVGLARALYEGRREAIGPDVTDAGLASLDDGHDGDTVARWMAGFLGQAR